MKKILALILALVMALSLVACGSKDNNDTPDDGKKTNTIKVGLICIGDENDQGYTYNFIRGKEAATEALAAKGINVEWVIKYNKGENDDCTNANIECAEEGCQLIINNSYGHEPFMLKVAGKSEYKDIQFIGCTNCGSRSDGLENTHNAFANIYEGRYVAGVVAGMKLQEMIDNGDITAEQAVIGYVGAFSFAEVISGFTAYYLGAKSVCPSVTMKVQFVGSWSDATEEANAASALCDAGCVMISQHSDNTTPATMAQTKGAFHTGYNNDMTGIAPEASLLSSRIAPLAGRRWVYGVIALLLGFSVAANVAALGLPATTDRLQRRYHRSGLVQGHCRRLRGHDHPEREDLRQGHRREGGRGGEGRRFPRVLLPVRPLLPPADRRDRVAELRLRQLSLSLPSQADNKL